MSQAPIDMTPLAEVFSKTLTNVVVLFGIPFACYIVFHLWRRKRGFKEIFRRAGLQLGQVKYIGYSVPFALALVAYFIFWPPSAEPFIQDGSAQKPFSGLGFNTTSLTMALLYGVVATGFCEEVLFRGLIAGSLSRRLPMIAANLVQATIFLLPHLLVLFIMPEIWPILFLIFAVGLLKGWLRIKSGSILGPWLIHATANVAMCLHVAIQTAG